MSKLTHVFFDIGGVLINLDAADFNARITAECAPGSPQDIFPNRFLGVIGKQVAEYHRGKYPLEAFLNDAHSYLRTTFGYCATPGKLLADWGDFLGAEITANRQVFEALKKHPGIQLGIISDTNEFHAEIIRQRYPWIFDSVAPRLCVLSHEHHAQKADNGALYEKMLERTGGKATSVLVIDNIPQILDTARLLGMKTILYSPKTDDLLLKVREQGLNI